MVARLLEDCPEGWEDHLSPSAVNFVKHVNPQVGGAKVDTLEETDSVNGSSSEGPLQSKRRHVVRNANTLKEVKSQSAINQLKGQGSAVVSVLPASKLPGTDSLFAYFVV
jgi:hypothetical protein